MAIESLAQQASLFLGSLLSSDAPNNEQASNDNARKAKTPEQSSAVVVTISEAARALIAPEKSGNSSQARQDAEDEKRDQLIEQLKARIAELEDEVEELEKTDLPEEEKLQQIQARQARIMELQQELEVAQLAKLEASGFTEGGGTTARGFGNSASTF